MTHPVYEALLAEVTDELERQVLEILTDASGKKSRSEMIMAVYGTYVPPEALASSVYDRKIREAVARLRVSGWPVISSSGEAGYVLEDDEEKIKAFALEQEARAEKERLSARRAYGWIGKARVIREARKSGAVSTQPNLL